MAQRKALGGLAALMVLTVAAIGVVVLLVSLLDTGEVSIPPLANIQPDSTPLIRIEGKDITRFHVNVGLRYEKTRAGKDGFVLPEHGVLLRLIDILVWEEILRRHQRPLTPEMISAERARQIRESRDKDKMREILAALDPYPGMFELFMVRPALANNEIYKLQGDKSIQAESFEKAERGLKEALREPDDFFRRMKDQEPKTYRRVDSRKPLEGVGPPGMPQQGLPPDEHARTQDFILKFAKRTMGTLTPGDVCPQVQDEEGTCLVLRLLDRTPEYVVYDVVSYPKTSFDAWFGAELNKLKGEVVDPATRELLKKELPAEHKTRRWLLGG